MFSDAPSLDHPLCQNANTHSDYLCAPMLLWADMQALLSSASLLTSPLTCFKCDEPYHTIPKLKLHLEKEFAAEKKKRLERVRRSGQQRSSDEEMF